MNLSPKNCGVLSMAAALAVPLFAIADTVPPEWVALYESEQTRVRTPWDSVAEAAIDEEGNAFCALNGEDDQGHDEIVLAKYNPVGELLWSTPYRGLRASDARELALDHEGNIYVAGVENDDATTVPDIVLVKFSPQGVVLWSSLSGLPSSDWPEGLVLNSEGQAYIGGTSYSVDGNHPNPNTSDYILIKYDIDGTLLWQRRFDGEWNHDDRPDDVAIDSAGNVIITGATTAFCYLDGDDDEACLTDITTLKYSPDGDLLWEQTFDGPTGGTDRGNVIAIDRHDNVHVGGVSIDREYSSRWITMKYNRRGRLRWVRYANENDDFEEVRQIAVAPQGHVYVGGGANFSIVRYSRWGHENWRRSLMRGRIAGLNLDPSGNLALGGWGQLTEDTNRGYLAAKVDPAGNLLWCGQWDRGSEGRHIARSSIVTKDGGILVAGYTFGTPTGDAAGTTVKFLGPTTPPPPIVSLHRRSALASEGGKRSRGSFVIQRQGSTDEELTVCYSLGGTAENGSDYETLSGEAVIPVGESRITVQIEVIDDKEAESQEHIVIDLEEKGHYRRGLSRSAAVTIFDNDRRRHGTRWWWWRRR